MEPSEQPVDPNASHHDGRHSRFTSHEKTDAVLRLLKGESVEIVSQELGVTINRIERWKSSFISAGTAELGRRKESSSKSRGMKRWVFVRQWIWLLFALVAVISMLVLVMQRSPQE